jgi:hypothetical protein
MQGYRLRTRLHEQDSKMLGIVLGHSEPMTFDHAHSVDT